MQDVVNKKARPEERRERSDNYSRTHLVDTNTDTDVSIQPTIIEKSPLDSAKWIAIMREQEQLAKQILDGLLKNESAEEIVLERAIPNLTALNSFLENKIELKDIETLDLSNPNNFFNLLTSSDQQTYANLKEIPKINYVSQALGNFYTIKEIKQRCPQEFQNLVETVAQANGNKARGKIVKPRTQPRGIGPGRNKPQTPQNDSVPENNPRPKPS